MTEEPENKNLLPVGSDQNAKGPTIKKAELTSNLFATLIATVRERMFVKAAHSVGHDVTGIAQLGALVRSRRLELGISQSELAARAATGRRFVSELEGGKTSVQAKELLHVLDALEIALIAQVRGDINRVQR